MNVSALGSAAMASYLKANAPSGSTASSSDVAQMATNIQGARHGHHHHHGGAGHSALSLLLGTDASTSTDATTPPTPALSGMATLLGLSSTQLTGALQSGTTLSALATQQGVSRTDLLSSVESELKAKAPAGASAFLGSQLQQIATTVIDGTGSAAASAAVGGASPGAPSSAGISALRAISSPTATNNLNALASATGLEPSSLLSRLQSGQGLGSLLGSVGQTGYGSTVASSVSGGVMYDEYA